VTNPKVTALSNTYETLAQFKKELVPGLESKSTVLDILKVQVGIAIAEQLMLLNQNVRRIADRDEMRDL
jgi:hypothetical protein